MFSFLCCRNSDLLYILSIFFKFTFSFLRWINSTLFDFLPDMTGWFSCSFAHISLLTTALSTIRSIFAFLFDFSFMTVLLIHVSLFLFSFCRWVDCLVFIICSAYHSFNWGSIWVQCWWNISLITSSHAIYLVSCKFIDTHKLQWVWISFLLYIGIFNFLRWIINLLSLNLFVLFYLLTLLMIWIVKVPINCWLLLWLLKTFATEFFTSLSNYFFRNMNLIEDLLISFCQRSLRLLLLRYL